MIFLYIVYYPSNQDAHPRCASDAHPMHQGYNRLKCASQMCIQCAVLFYAHLMRIFRCTCFADQRVCKKCALDVHKIRSTNPFHAQDTSWYSSSWLSKLSSFRQVTSPLYYRNDPVKYNLNIFQHQSFNLAERKSQKSW